MKGPYIRAKVAYLGLVWLFCSFLPSNASDTLSLPIEHGRIINLRQVPFYTEASLNKNAEEMSQLFSTPSLAEKIMRVEQDQIQISQSAYWARIRSTFSHPKSEAHSSTQNQKHIQATEIRSTFSHPKSEAHSSTQNQKHIQPTEFRSTLKPGRF